MPVTRNRPLARSKRSPRPTGSATSAAGARDPARRHRVGLLRRDEHDEFVLGGGRRFDVVAVDDDAEEARTLDIIESSSTK
jgi:hypothetical protein